jgi:hypothetical protein
MSWRARVDAADWNTIPGRGRGAPASAVSPLVADRPRLVTQARAAAAVVGLPERVAGDVSRRRPNQADADPARVRRRRLERIAPRPLRRTGVPLQVVINLSQPGADNTGGEFLLYEQRARAQSRGTAMLIPHGHGLLFTTRDRPVASKGGWSAAPVRHGVSIIRSGERLTLALVMHDAA